MHSNLGSVSNGNLAADYQELMSLGMPAPYKKPDKLDRLSVTLRALEWAWSLGPVSHIEMRPNFTSIVLREDSDGSSVTYDGKDGIQATLKMARARAVPATAEQKLIRVAQIIGHTPVSSLVEQVEKEWADLSMLINHCTQAYGHMTNGRITKPNTLPEAVFAVADDVFTERVEEATKELQGELDKATADMVAWEAFARKHIKGVEDVATLTGEKLRETLDVHLNQLRTVVKLYNEKIRDWQTFAYNHLPPPNPPPNPDKNSDLRMLLGEALNNLRADRRLLWDALKELCLLKEMKDLEGKTQEYLTRQPKAWEKAKELLKEIKRT